MALDQTTAESIPAATTPAAVIISYQKRPPRRRGWWKLWLFVFVSIALGVAGWQFGPELYERSKFLYEQSQWTNYHAPPDQLVLFQDQITTFPTQPYRRAVKADALRSKNADFTVEDSKDGADDFIGRSNPKLASFLKAHTPPNPIIASGGSIRRWSRIMPPPPPPAILYCGRRTCDAGERLLVVSCGVRNFNFDSDYQHPEKTQTFRVITEIYEPATFRRPFRNTATSGGIIGRIPIDDSNSIQFFAGQSDPNDDSRFTIRYIMNGIENTIEGQLQADGATVVLNAHGPLFTKPSR